VAASDNPDMKPLRLCIAALAIGIISLCSGAQEWSRVSPFTRVEISGDDARVVYDGVAHELISIEQLPTPEILAFCRKTYGRNADERFAADIVEVLAAMGKRPGQTVHLVLRDPKTRELTTVERAPLTAENRKAVMDAARRGDQLRPEQMPAALDAFEAALSERWSYLGASNFDHAAMIAGIRRRAGQEMPPQQFLFELQKVIGRGIDAHADVSGWDRSLPPGYLPFLVEPGGDRFVAFKPDRTALLSADHPYIESIDAKPLADWIAAASAYIPDGSPQYVRGQGLRLLRSIQFLRREMGLKEGQTIDVALASKDGNGRKTLTLPVAQSSPVYGIWPPENRQPAVPRDIDYVRITSMDGETGKRLAAAVSRAADARGLIIDVRDNGGGIRDGLRELVSLLFKPGQPPRVVNAAAYRLHPEHGPELMKRRFLYPENWDGWSAAEREAIDQFKRTFRAQWAPPRDKYSDWHYLVLSRRPDLREPAFDKPVVVLMNAKCFSATDVFLSALKGMPNVTLVGTPSGGGSANVNTVRLAQTPVRVRLGTMVSFQADGRMFDRHGVEPDVRVDPAPEFFIGGADNQLEEAVRIIGKKTGP
jgi:hypothetical protein